MTGRVSQGSPRPFPSSPAEMAGTPGQPGSGTGGTRAAERGEEVDSGVFSQAADQRRAVQESVEKINEFIRPYVTSLQFSIDEDLGRIVVKIMDSETKEVIKQFPSEEALALAKALEKVAGLFVKQEA